MPVAAVTMVYNEPEFLPIWIKYYGEQFGKDNLYIIDHGTDDGSTSDCYPANVIKIPRTAKDDDQRTRFISGFVGSLLEYYGTVVHTDVDEFVVPDPSKYSNLHEYCQQRSKPVVTSIGLNVAQKISTESPIDLHIPILSQRQWVRFVTPMCKQNIVSKRTNWTPGFHGSDHAPVFDDVYLFHLRYFDLKYGLDRLARTRVQQWSSDTAGSHQRVADETWRKWFAIADIAPTLPDFLTYTGKDELERLKSQFLSTAEKSPKGQFYFKHYVSPEMFLIPEFFRNAF